MADYPVTLPVGARTRVEPDAGMITDIATDGTVRTRIMHDVTRFDITIDHPYLSSAERTTLLAHYATDKALTFNFVAPWGTTYIVRYLNEPRGQPHAGGYWTFSTSVSGVAA